MANQYNSFILTRVKNNLCEKQNKKNMSRNRDKHQRIHYNDIHEPSKK